MLTLDHHLNQKSNQIVFLGLRAIAFKAQLCPKGWLRAYLSRLGINLKELGGKHSSTWCQTKPFLADKRQISDHKALLKSP